VIAPRALLVEIRVNASARGIVLKRRQPKGFQAMARIVQKFGGTSVGDLDRIRKVAERALETQRQGHEVVLVVSAMSGETNRLIELAKAINPVPYSAEYDMLLASGEQISCALVAMAINRLEPGKSESFLGNQVKIRTDSLYSKARIQSIDTELLDKSLAAGKIPVIAGFQGVDEQGKITTLGRGGSDTTAVAIAIALQASRCDIYTDVDGVYTADPRICPQAHRLDHVTYDEMLEMAHLGAKVLQIRSVELAAKYKMPVRVLSSFTAGEGTLVESRESSDQKSIEEALVTSVIADTNQVKLTLKHLPRRSSTLAEVFGQLSRSGIVVDIIIQEPLTESTQALTFTVSREDHLPAERVLSDLKNTHFPELQIASNQDLAKVSIVGVGMQNHPGVAARLFQLLSENGIAVELVSTSEIKISCLVAREKAQLAVQKLHAGFLE
jgi:aspartate kinase